MGDFSQQWNRGVQQRAAETAQRRSEQSFWKGFENGQAGANPSPGGAYTSSYVPVSISWGVVFRMLGSLLTAVGSVLSFVPAGAGAVALCLAKSREPARLSFVQAYKACVRGVIAHAAISGATLIALFWSRAAERRLGRLIVKWDGLGTLFDDALIASILSASQVAAFCACTFSIWYATRSAEPPTPLSGSALRIPALSAAAIALTGWALAACVLGIGA